MPPNNTAQRFLGPSPQEQMAKQLLAINPQLGSPSKYIDGEAIPTTAQGLARQKQNIGQQLDLKTAEVKKALSDRKKNFGLSTLSNILKFTPLAPIAVAGDIAMAAGARFGGGGGQAEGPDKEIAKANKLLSLGQRFNPGMLINQQVQNIASAEMASKQGALASAQEEYAKAGSWMGWGELANTAVSLGHSINSIYKSATAPTVKPGMENVAAEQSAAGLDPTQATHSSPLKDFSEWTGTEGWGYGEVGGYSELPAKGHPGTWGMSKYGTWNQPTVGTGYMGAQEPVGIQKMGLGPKGADIHGPPFSQVEYNELAPKVIDGKTITPKAPPTHTLPTHAAAPTPTLPKGAVSPTQAVKAPATTRPVASGPGAASPFQTTAKESFLEKTHDDPFWNPNNYLQKKQQELYS